MISSPFSFPCFSPPPTKKSRFDPLRQAFRLRYFLSSVGGKRDHGTSHRKHVFPHRPVRASSKKRRSLYMLRICQVSAPNALREFFMVNGSPLLCLLKAHGSPMRRRRILPQHNEHLSHSPEKMQVSEACRMTGPDAHEQIPSQRKKGCPRHMSPTVPETLRCPTPLLLPESLWLGRSGRDGIEFDEPETSVFHLPPDEPSLPVFRPCPAMPQAGTHEEGRKRRRKKRKAALRTFSTVRLNVP